MVRVDTKDLISSVEVAEILGLSQKNSVTTYLKRYSDFPQPAVELANGRIRLWIRNDVVEWSASRKAY